MEAIEARYKAFLKLTSVPEAAALLCVASSMMDVAARFRCLESAPLEDQLSAGIRHGIFGSAADLQADIRDLGEEARKGLVDIAESISEERGGRKH